MVFSVVETDVGVVQRVGLVVSRDAILGEVVAFAIVVARDHAKGTAVGERAEAQENISTTAAGEIVGREIRAGGFEFVASEFEQPEGLDGEIFREADGGLEHVNGQESFF